MGSVSRSSTSTTWSRLRAIVAVCAGIPAEQILDDVDRADIVLWRLTVLGEAARSVSPAVRAENPEVGLE